MPRERETVEAASTVARWRLLLLGTLRAEHEDRVVPRFRTRKTGALLAYLALHPQRLHPRETLINLFWPDADLDAGRQSLNAALVDLRRRFGASSGAKTDAPSIIIADRAAAGVNPALLTTDVEEFEAGLRAAGMAESAAAQVEALERATGLYQGDLMPGHYDDWVIAERDRLADLYAGALCGLAGALERAGRLDEALERARQSVAQDPLREEAHCTLMRLYAAAGRPAAAKQQYRELEQILQDELDAQPSREAQLLLSLIEEGGVPVHRPQTATPAGWADPPGAPATALAPAPTLTSPASRFIGRIQEMSEIRRLLASHRMVTLTGAGGSGKTRLALEVARGLADEPPGAAAAVRAARDGLPTQARTAYPDGIRMVELAAISDPLLVLSTVGSALGLGPAGGSSREALLAALQDRRMLVLLDNCEHLLPACSDLVHDISRSCPQVTVLATSREPLGVEGEARYRVPSLATPEPVDAPSATHVADCESARLFVDRARLHDPVFDVTNSNAAAVTAICQRLDGIPLALELAAARVSVLSVLQIADRLNDRFALLSRGSRMALPRHRTLTALIDWSYQLLTDAERALLRRLSVFVGGFTLEAAENIGIGCWALGVGSQHPTPNTQHPVPILDLLSSLVDKSLVLFEERGGTARYRMLETIAQFAEQRLIEQGEADEVRDRHLFYFLGQAELAGKLTLVPQEGDVASNWFEMERGNVHAALGRCLSLKNTAESSDRYSDAALRFIASLRWYLFCNGSDDRKWIAAALSGADAAGPARAHALCAMGGVCLREGDDVAAYGPLQESLAYWRSQNNGVEVAGVLWYLSKVLSRLGRRAEALACLKEDLAIYQDLDYKELVAHTFLAMTNELRDQGDLPAAWDASNRHRAASEGTEDASICSLVMPAWLRGDLDRAIESIERFHGHLFQTSNRIDVANFLENLGMMALGAGDYDRAVRCLSESRAVWRSIGNVVHGRAPELPPEALGAADGGYRMARSLAEGNIAAYGELGEPGFIAGCRLALAHAARREGDTDYACEQEARVAAVCQSLDTNAHSYLMGGAGNMARREGDYHRARALYRQALDSLDRSCDSYALAWLLEDAAGLASRLGAHERAVRLLGAAGAMGERVARVSEVSLAPGSTFPAEWWRVQRAGRTTLGEEDYATAWQEGRALTAEQAVEHMLQSFRMDVPVKERAEGAPAEP